MCQSKPTSIYRSPDRSLLITLKFARIWLSMKVFAQDQKLEKMQADALAVFLFEGEKLAVDIERLDKALSGAISETIKLGDFKGKLYEVTPIYTHGKVPSIRIFLVGTGKKGEFDARLARNVAGAVVRRAVKIGVKNLAVYLRSGINAEEVIEGVGLASYDPALYKTKKEENGEIEELILIGEVKQQTIKHGQVITESTNWVRKLISEPANVMTPAAMVGEAKKLAKNYKFAIEIIDEEEAKKKRFGAFAGVARGSEEPSFLVVLKYRGGGKQTLGVVGKGITFDSGGISLKPSGKMHEMKMDMAGAAAAFGVMKVVGELRPKTNVIMTAPLTENLPSGRALKPGDILRSLAGKTIEVINTDAEGRVVLADALTYVQKLGATHVVDLATLTGAVQVALGSEAAAILGNKENWVRQVTEAGKFAGERLWQLPIYAEHKELLKSEVADVANIPPIKGAGVIAGAVFLEEFIEKKNAWAHLDIASTAWLESEKPYMAKGPTGFGVRTLVGLIESLEKGT